MIEVTITGKTQYFEGGSDEKSASENPLNLPSIAGGSWLDSRPGLSTGPEIAAASFSPRWTYSGPSPCEAAKRLIAATATWNQKSTTYSSITSNSNSYAYFLFVKGGLGNPINYRFLGIIGWHWPLFGQGWEP